MGTSRVLLLATVEIRVVRLGSFQNLYLSFAIVEITHGVTANRDDTDFHHAKPQILYPHQICVQLNKSGSDVVGTKWKGQRV